LALVEQVLLRQTLPATMVVILYLVQSLQLVVEAAHQILVLR
jgi:hypothetical protein